MENQNLVGTPPPTNSGIIPPASTIGGTPSDDGQGGTALGGEAQELAELQALLVDRSQRISEPGYLFEIGGTPCLPLEGIAAISGEAKKGKSQFLTILEAVLLSGKSFGNICRRYHKPLKVLHVDTEQTPYDVQCNIDRLCNIAQWEYSCNLQDKGITYLRMRKLGVSDRLKQLDNAVKLINPDVIVIDGCRDLVNDFNDVSESGEVMSKLMQYADLGKAVWTILHVNEGTSKMRGHLGTELLNKCADKWTVSKEGDTFQTKHICRGREVTALPSFKFEKSNLVPCDVVTAVANVPEKETAEQKYTRLVEEIFEGVEELTCNDFDNKLSNRSASTLQNAKRWRKILMAKGVISWNDNQNVIFTKPF